MSIARRARRWLVVAVVVASTTRPAAPSEASSGAPAAVRQYGAIVAAWAAGEPGQVERLDRFEEAVADLVADHGSAVSQRHRVTRTAGVPFYGSHCLAAVERAVHLELAAVDPELLLPVAVLHTLAYREQMRSPLRAWLGHESRLRVEALLRLYAKRAPAGSEARAARAQLLTGLGAAHYWSFYMQEQMVARELFDRARKLDRELRAPAYWSAVLSERFGEYKRAAREFDELLSDHPGDPEIRLRLAVNSVRVGRFRRAEELLVELTENTDEIPEWIGIVAFQELSRLRRSMGQSVVADLERGLASYPREPQLGLQLAHGMSTGRRVDWRAVDELIERVESWAGEASGPSPRRVYEHPTMVDVEAVAEQIESRIEPLLPRLAETIPTLPGNRVAALHSERECRILATGPAPLPADDVAGDR